MQQFFGSGSNHFFSDTDHAVAAGATAFAAAPAGPAGRVGGGAAHAVGVLDVREHLLDVVGDQPRVGGEEELRPSGRLVARPHEEGERRAGPVVGEQLTAEADAEAEAQVHRVECR